MLARATPKKIRCTATENRIIAPADEEEVEAGVLHCGCAAPKKKTMAVCTSM